MNRELNEYDFSEGVRGKYVERYRHGTSIVVLDADKAEQFPGSEAAKKVPQTPAKTPRQKRP